MTGGSLVALHLTETNAFCTSCHEMQVPLHELKGTAHESNVFGIQPGCANCHVPPTFVAGVWRHMKAVTEVWGSLTGKLDTRPSTKHIGWRWQESLGRIPGQ